LVGSVLLHTAVADARARFVTVRTAAGHLLRFVVLRLVVDYPVGFRWLHVVAVGLPYALITVTAFFGCATTFAVNTYVRYAVAL